MRYFANNFYFFSFLFLVTYSQVLFFALSCDSPDLNFNNSGFEGGVLENEKWS